MNNTGHLKILVLVPHQDDELSLMGSLLFRLKKLGHHVELLYTTNGDYTGEELARKKELQKVVKLLEIDNVTYLGYPDHGYKKADPNIYNDGIYVFRNGRTQTIGVLDDEFVTKKAGLMNH